MDELVTRRTGKEILSAKGSSRRGQRGALLHPSHRVHGYAAGPTIGLWDRQDGVPGQGDCPLWPDTAHSIELQARAPVAEWDHQVVQFMLEEDAWFDGSRCRFLDGRRTELRLV